MADAEPVAASVTDHRIAPRGVLPRRTQTWLMVGTILRGEEGQLIAEYYFRDIHLNPTFAKDQFTRKALQAK